ncbi:MAG: hypothetical protein HY043_21955 [Verrucomicrobia bacterium]|nr:hypothetical protein [Verrucomicrobiota bacterium]
MSAGFFGLIPLLFSWLACFWLSRELAARRIIHPDWRLSWLIACVAWGTLLTLVVEAASQFRALNAPTMLGTWTFLSLLLGGFAARLAAQRGKLAASAVKEFFKWFKLSAQAQPPLDVKLMSWFAGLLILLLGFIAFTLPTTNWDSLTYHLPRVLHWIQQGSVEHFATNNTRQIEFAPWSGFVITTLHLLQGSDQAANLVQWFAMLTSVVGATFIAQHLLALRSRTESPDNIADGAGGHFCARVNSFTALLVVTLPIGAVEAITTQTDYVTTAWLVCFTVFALLLAKEPANLSHAIVASLSLALGVLTKATMYSYALPIVLGLTWLAFARWTASRLRWRLAGIFVLGFLLLNVGHLVRNYHCFGSPLGSPHILALERNQHISFGGTFSNVIRNLLLQTNTGVAPVTRVINAFAESLHRATGHDLNDPDTTYAEAPFAFRDQFLVTDSYASAPIHLLLVAVAVILLFVRARKHGWLLAYGALFVASFVLFCALLRWQHWHGRIHLAYFVLLTPLVAVVFVKYSPRWLVALISVVAAGFVVLSMVHNRSRPLLDLKLAALPRERQCLQPLAGHLHEPLAQICDDLAAAHCERIGLKLGFDDAEYPLWLMLRRHGFNGWIEHVRVENESRSLSVPGGRPDAVISIAAPQSPPFTIEFPHQTDYGLFTVFWSEPASQWTQFMRFDFERAQSRLMTSADTELLFSHRLITFYHRAARGGTLKLTGSVTDSSDVVVRHNLLRVTTNDGEATLALDGHPVSIELSIPPPESAIKLAVLEPGASGDGIFKLRDFHWSWETDSANPVTNFPPPPTRATK